MWLFILPCWPLRRPLFRQEQISTYRHLGPAFNATIGKNQKKGKVYNILYNLQ